MYPHIGKTSGNGNWQLAMAMTLNFNLFPAVVRTPNPYIKRIVRSYKLQVLYWQLLIFYITLALKALQIS